MKLSHSLITRQTYHDDEVEWNKNEGGGLGQRTGNSCTYMREACCQCEQKKFFYSNLKLNAEVGSVDD